MDACDPILFDYTLLKYIEYNWCNQRKKAKNTSGLESKVNGFYIRDSFKISATKELKGSDATLARE